MHGEGPPGPSFACTFGQNDGMDPICDDLHAEHDVLDAIVAAVPEADWDRATPAEGWAVRDQISHLWFFDQRALLALTDPEEFAVLANTWYRPLWNTTVGSLIPATLWVASDFGLMSMPPEFHRKLFGRLPVGGVLGGADVGGVDGRVDGDALVGAPVGVTPPVHAVPLRVKLAGTGLLPVQEPLNPNAVLALVAMPAL